MTQRVTFIHTSDFQWGMQRWFLEGEAQARFSAARLAAVERLGDLATRTGAQFIVAAGDVFEHNSLTRQTTGRANEVLAGLPVPVYLLPGNHDPLVADSIFRTATAENVHVLGDSVPQEVADGVELVGAPLLTKHVNRDLVAEALQGLEPTENIRIAVGHGQVSSRTSTPSPAEIDLAQVEQAVRAGTIDYLALGDTHSTQNLSATGAVWFSGSPEVTDFHGLETDNGERDSGNALVVTIEKDGTGPATVTVEKHHVGQWRFDAVSAELDSLEDVESFLSQLRAYENKDRTVIKYGLTGTLSLTAQRALESGLDELTDIFAALYPRERLMDLVTEPDPDELDNLGLTGFAASALEELVEDMSAGDLEARDATNLLFRLTAKGA